MGPSPPPRTNQPSLLIFKRKSARLRPSAVAILRAARSSWSLSALFPVSEFFSAIEEGREPNASVAQVLSSYRVLDEVEAARARLAEAQSAWELTRSGYRAEDVARAKAAP